MIRLLSFFFLSRGPSSSCRHRDWIKKREGPHALYVYTNLEAVTGLRSKKPLCGRNGPHPHSIKLEQIGTAELNAMRSCR